MHSGPSSRCMAFFISHTDLTELTDIISLDVNVFCALCEFCVPLSGPTDIRVHLWHLCALPRTRIIFPFDFPPRFLAPAKKWAKIWKCREIGVYLQP